MSADLWIEAAAPQLSGCPLITMQNEWLNSAREFFVRSTCWRQDLDPVTITAGLNTYTLAAPIPDTVINYVHLLSIPNRYITPSADTPKIRADDESETPTQFSTTPEPNIIVLWPMPTKDIDDMIAKVSLVPTALDTVLPEYLKTQYFDVLLDGMLGRLFNYKNKPYSSEQMAQYHLTRFRSSMARVRANTIHGLNESQNQWNFPQGFANGRF